MDAAARADGQLPPVTTQRTAVRRRPRVQTLGRADAKPAGPVGIYPDRPAILAALAAGDEAFAVREERGPHDSDRQVGDLASAGQVPQPQAVSAATGDQAAIGADRQVLRSFTLSQLFMGGDRAALVPGGQLPDAL